MRTAYRVVSALVALTIAYEVRAADPVMYGDWGVGYGEDNSFMYAATANDSGELFGEYCYFKSKACDWYVILNSACKPGLNTPVLANTDSSAVALIFTCKGQMTSQKFASQINDWKSLEATITDSIHLGFAIPMAEDNFTAVRFSLKGRTGSTQTLEAAFVAALKKGNAAPSNATSRGTADVKL